MENYKLNKFFKNIKLKKQYIYKLNDEIKNLNEIKNKKNEYTAVKNFNIEEDNLVKYIIDIRFSRTNTLIHVMDFSGNLKFHCSAGKLNYSGKSKKARRLVVRSIYKILISKLDYLSNQPVALHLKNINSSLIWIIRLLKKKFFIKIIKVYTTYPSNGCRKKKIRRKKFRTKRRKIKVKFKGKFKGKIKSKIKGKTKKKKKWSSGLRRQIVNLLSFLIAGSNPAFFKRIKYRNFQYLMQHKI